MIFTTDQGSVCEPTMPQWFLQKIFRLCKFLFSRFRHIFSTIYRLLNDIQVVYVVLVHERQQITIKTSRSVGKNGISSYVQDTDVLNTQILTQISSGKYF